MNNWKVTSRDRIASPEDIIVQKLYGDKLGDEISDRQWQDVLVVLKVQGRHIEYPYLKNTARQLDITELYQLSYDRPCIILYNLQKIIMLSIIIHNSTIGITAPCVKRRRPDRWGNPSWAKPESKVNHQQTPIDHQPITPSTSQTINTRQITK